ncbi:MAG: magnesium/cobalt transporter CorA [Candidatus Sumerlaeia bacterium]
MLAGNTPLFDDYFANHFDRQPGGQPMTRWFLRRSGRVGLPPGSLVQVEDRQGGPPAIQIFDYSEHDWAERADATLADCVPPSVPGRVRWINVDGINQTGVLETIGRNFDLHPLMLEDVLHTDQRAKFEDYGASAFMVVRMVHFNADETVIISEQIAFVIGPDWVITFQETRGDVFDPIRERIRQNKGRVRSRKADYLAYTLLDAIVDHYFAVLEKLSDEMEELEDEILDDPRQSTLHEVYRLRREVIYLRRVVWPLREMLGSLVKGTDAHFTDETLLFLRDVADHSIRVLETLDTFRDMLGSMVELYLSSNSNRMNEVMKVLTIIATVFIPITFIAGVYGMNFDWMPELRWKWAYPAVWAVMLTVAGGLLWYFKKRNWL